MLTKLFLHYLIYFIRSIMLFLFFFLQLTFSIYLFIIISLLILQIECQYTQVQYSTVQWLFVALSVFINCFMQELLVALIPGFVFVLLSTIIFDHSIIFIVFQIQIARHNLISLFQLSINTKSFKQQFCLTLDDILIIQIYSTSKVSNL